MADQQALSLLFWDVNTFIQFLLIACLFVWVWHLAAITQKFYRYIFFGALTILVALPLYSSYVFLIYTTCFRPGLGDDQRGSVNHFMQMALFIDLCFYFTGLASRDREIALQKTLFQQQLIKQLEENKILQAKFTGELEHQVEEKTTELLLQQNALEKEKDAKLQAEFNRRFSESELKALRSQMNPHFIFNILNAIESYALENNKEDASKMIQKFSRLTRLILENSMNALVLFEQDWKALQLYIELEQMRYAEKFTTVFEIDEQLLEGACYIPPMIIQPFVENAIVHGLRNQSKGDRLLRLAAHLENRNILIVVEDNGIGRVEASLLKLNDPLARRSLGLKVTQDRIAMFNNLNPHMKAKIEIEDLSPGTRVKIRLPQQSKIIL